MSACFRPSKVLTIAAFALLIFSCREKSVPLPAVPTDPKVQKLKLPPGFHAEHLYGPSENGEGSWVSMTFDAKGRLLASDQFGAIYRMTLPPIGDTTTKTTIEKIQLTTHRRGVSDTSHVDIGYAHGLLWAFNSLYVMINHNSDTNFSRPSGLYRLQDLDGDDQFDTIRLVKALHGEGEHGPHSIVLSPDRQSLYIVAGNFTDIPAMDSYTNTPGKQNDNLLPFVKDPNGHDNNVQMHGGWIARTSPDGSNWELYSSGFRNPFDIAFNEAGDLFTFDSDMEWDLGLPWYRPTRICHVTSGSEFGWRPGDEKWSPAFPDNLPPILNIGQGSPTNVVAGTNAHFPERYRRCIFAFDWSFGIIYAIHLKPRGASYEASGEEFVSGSPLPLTDGVIGPDGAMYFLTGGRKLESDLYRVYYGDNRSNAEPLAVAPPTPEQAIRRQLETFHGAANADAVNFAWPYLKHNDRFVRYAARIAVEHQPVDQWIDRLFLEVDPTIRIQAALAYARHGSGKDAEKVVASLEAISFSGLPEAGRIDWLRAIELMVARFGKPSKDAARHLVVLLEQYYPSPTNNELNRELVKILAALEDPMVVNKTIPLLASAEDDNSTAQQTFTQSSDLILRNPSYGMDIAGTLSKLPPQQQTFYATALSKVKSGWTPDTREQYFHWFASAFSYRGGHSFVGFVDQIRKSALRLVPKKQFAHFNAVSGDSIVALGGTDLAIGASRPKGPGREWRVDSAMVAIDTVKSPPDFANGRAMFRASLCISCHSMRGEGGSAGPDLTQLGTRFSRKDMLESIIDPSKTISDQYAAMIFEMKSGSSVVGRLISQDAKNYVVAQNPFAMQETRTILKSDVEKTKLSPVSMMLPGLVNRLNAQELKNLLTYLMAGGNADHPVYKNW